MIFGGLFDFDKKEEEIKKLEEITKESNFWDDVSLANKKITELNNLKKEINNICSLKEKINNNLEILSLLKNENDEELQKLVEEDIENIKNSLEELKLELYLNHEYDHKNCILEIHAGAGYIYSDARVQGLEPFWYAIFSIIFVIILALVLTLNLVRINKRKQKEKEGAI